MENISSTPEELVAPECAVELHDLQTKSGKPFVVLCQRVADEVLVEIVRGLPGYSPPPPAEGTADDEAREREALRFLGWAPAIIEAGTFLRYADGREVRPAFYFGDEPKGGAAPGRYLSARDRALLVGSIMKLSGWLGGAADRVRFHGREQGGSGAGAATVAPVPGDRDAPARADGSEVPDAR